MLSNRFRAALSGILLGNFLWREREPTGGIIAPKSHRSVLDEPVEETESASRPVVLDVSTFSTAE
jgi:hypothetical protein